VSSALFDLTGRTALVTGAASGIGARLAVGLAEAGADVGCLDLDTQIDHAENTAATIRSLGRNATALTGDVTDAASIEAALDTHLRQLARLDIAVNCAGINHSCPAEDMADADWRRVIDVNLTGVFTCCRAEGRHMLKTQGGSIINIASMSATVANRGLLQAHYNASKAAVKHLSTTLALEWARRGIRVNSISPGYIATPMISGPEWKPKTDRFAEDTPWDDSELPTTSSAPPCSSPATQLATAPGPTYSSTAALPAGKDVCARLGCSSSTPDRWRACSGRAVAPA